jgi:hypothetical protein
MVTPSRDHPCEAATSRISSSVSDSAQRTGSPPRAFHQELEGERIFRARHALDQVAGWR